MPRECTTDRLFLQVRKQPDMIPYNPQGLTPEEVAASRAAHGENIITPQRDDSAWRLLAEKFRDPIIIVLLVAAALSLAMAFMEGNFTETIGILCAILLATCVGFLFEWDAMRRFRRLNRVNDEQPSRYAEERDARDSAPRSRRRRPRKPRSGRDGAGRRRTGRSGIAANGRVDAHGRTRNGEVRRRGALRPRSDLPLQPAAARHDRARRIRPHGRHGRRRRHRSGPRHRTGDRPERRTDAAGTAS